MTPCNDSHENNSSEPSGRTLRHAFGKKGTHQSRKLYQATNSQPHQRVPLRIGPWLRTSKERGRSTQSEGRRLGEFMPLETQRFARLRGLELLEGAPQPSCLAATSPLPGTCFPFTGMQQVLAREMRLGSLHDLTHFWDHFSGNQTDTQGLS